MPENSATRTPTTWTTSQRTISGSPVPALMAILNVTPDSFSDGGKYVDVSAAVAQAFQFGVDGASILDLGGESTRPNSTPIDASTELARVIPVVRRLVESDFSLPISIDTSKPEVARECLLAGAEIINDVSGFRSPEMVQVAVEFKPGVCAMHMRGTPQNMQDDLHYDNIVQEILSYLRAQKTLLIEAGIPANRICLDPGIGFGKSHEQNLTLLQQISQFHSLNSPLLVGHSRKGFIGKILRDPELERDSASLGIAVGLAIQGVQVIRLHEVASVRRALLALSAMHGFSDSTAS